MPVGYARRQNLTCLELVLLLFFDLGNAHESDLPISSWITQRKLFVEVVTWGNLAERLLLQMPKCEIVTFNILHLPKY